MFVEHGERLRGGSTSLKHQPELNAEACFWRGGRPASLPLGNQIAAQLWALALPHTSGEVVGA